MLRNRPARRLVGGRAVTVNAEAIFAAGHRNAIILVVGRNDCPGGIQLLSVSIPHVQVLSWVWEATVENCTAVTGYVRGRTRKVVLQEDDANTIRWLMYIAHSKSHKLPPRLHLDELVRLGETLDRYEVGHVVTASINHWLAPHLERVRTFGYEHYEQWLYVAYEFGLEEEYISLANHLVFYCRTNARLDLLAPGTDRPIVGTYPPRALAVIGARRHELIAKMLKAAYDLLDDMRTTNRCQLHGASNDAKFLCTSANKLRLERYLSTLGWMPSAQHANLIRLSVEEVAMGLLNAAIMDNALLPLNTVSGHAAIADDGPPPPIPVAGPEAHVRAAILGYDDLHEDCGIGTRLQNMINLIVKGRPIGADWEIMKEIRDRAELYGRSLFEGYNFDAVPRRDLEMNPGWIS